MRPVRFARGDETLHDDVTDWMVGCVYLVACRSAAATSALFLSVTIWICWIPKSDWIHIKDLTLLLNPEDSGHYIALLPALCDSERFYSQGCAFHHNGRAVHLR